MWGQPPSAVPRAKRAPGQPIPAKSHLTLAVRTVEEYPEGWSIQNRGRAALKGRVGR